MKAPKVNEVWEHRKPSGLNGATAWSDEIQQDLISFHGFKEEDFYCADNCVISLVIETDDFSKIAKVLYDCSVYNIEYRHFYKKISNE